GISGAVWFMAQSFAFCFSVMALYYATTDNKKHALWSLLFWGLSVGCRPFQIVWLPLLLVFIFQKYNEDNMKQKIKSITIASIPMLVLAAFMAWLNYARFGSILEFGHNYLPCYANKPQFSTIYLKHHLLIYFFSLKFSDFSTSAFWLTNTIYLAFIAFLMLTIKVKKSKFIIQTITIICVMAFVHICLLAMHDTLAGWGWGSRYIIDTTPFIFFATVLLYDEKYKKVLIISSSALLLIGFIVNFCGTIVMYRKF
ncbi:MAG: hypothetical protein FWD64_11505, partial [Acidobacteriaceae bacterium]|nr:hypothetical protein [Acidobacteriaceae bacterium]